MKTKLLYFLCCAFLAPFSCAALELPDGQEARHEQIAPASNAHMLAEYSALDQQQKDDLFMGAVARNDKEHAALLLESRARIDATSDNIHLFLPEGVLADLAQHMMHMLDVDAEHIKAIRTMEQAAGVPTGTLEQNLLREIRDDTLNRLGKKIRAVDVATAHGHHDMAKFLLDHPARNRLTGPLAGFSPVLGGKRKKKVAEIANIIAIIKGDVDLVKMLFDYSLQERQLSHFKRDHSRIAAYRYLSFAESTGNHAIASHLLERQGPFAVDVSRHDKTTFKPLLHTVVLHGDNETLAKLLTRECQTVQFPELDDQIHTVVVAARNEHQALQQHHFPTPLVELVLAYKNRGFDRYQLVENLEPPKSLLQKAKRTLRRSRRCEQGHSDAWVEDLVLTSHASRTSLTLADGSGNTPLMLAQSLLSPSEALESKEDDASEKVELVDPIKRQECVALLERQPCALAKALIQKYLNSQSLKRN
jgi:hypothetical protein